MPYPADLPRSEGHLPCCRGSVTSSPATVAVEKRSGERYGTMGTQAVTRPRRRGISSDERFTRSVKWTRDFTGGRIRDRSHAQEGR
jgi:hypothetical protein